MKFDVGFVIFDRIKDELVGTLGFGRVSPSAKVYKSRGAAKAVITTIIRKRKYTDPRRFEILTATVEIEDTKDDDTVPIPAR